MPRDPSRAASVTVAYVKTPIGTTDFAMSSMFADVGDVSAIQIVARPRRQPPAALPLGPRRPVPRYRAGVMVTFSIWLDAGY